MLRTLTDAAAEVRAAHSKRSDIQRELDSVKAQKMKLEEALELADEALSRAQNTLNKMAVHGEESAA